MLKSRFDRVMERRSTQIIEQIRDWFPKNGPMLDVGSGTGHLTLRLERELGIDVVPADVCDMHVMGRPPQLINDGALPFADDSHSAALLVFMLHYPADPVELLAEAARVSTGPIIIMQSLYSGPLGYAWLRAREFVWTYVAFHVSKVIGYVPATAHFTMSARRFYSARSLERDVESAGLEVSARRERVILPGNRLNVGAWRLERRPNPDAAVAIPVDRSAP